jgi:hypothetical protein
MNRAIVMPNVAGGAGSYLFAFPKRLVTDSLQGSQALKPDAVGCDEKIAGDKQVSWWAIHIPVEDKRNARCMFASSPSRKQVHVIVL